eukprot:1378488-Amorphochlora_amoeboformis.AAC.1
MQPRNSAEKLNSTSTRQRRLLDATIIRSPTIPRWPLWASRRLRALCHSLKGASTDDDDDDDVGEEVAALVVDNGSGMYKAGFAGNNAPRGA